MQESELLARVCNALTDAGWRVIRMNSGKATIANTVVPFYTLWGMPIEYRHSGASDAFAVRLGRVVFIETKAPRGSQRKSQKAFQTFVESSGTEYRIVRSLDDIRDLTDGQRVN